MRIIIFGTGIRYKRYKSRLTKDTEIVAIIDNDKSLWNCDVDNLTVYEPKRINEFEYDCVLLMSKYAEDMRKQLVEYGVPDDKIWEWKRYAKAKLNDVVYTYGERRINAEKSVLLITTDVNLNGGSMAVVYAAEAFAGKGYDTVIAAPYIDERLKSKASQEGIGIMVIPGLPYLDKNSVFYKLAKSYDFVLVNVLQMINCVYELSKIRIVAWWLHECKDMYPIMLKEIELLKDEINFSNVEVFAVSKIAENNFKQYFPKVNVGILPYGIPDERVVYDCKDTNGKLIIALIGGLCEGKAQDILADAIEFLTGDERNQIEVWFIGKDGGMRDKYSRRIHAMIEKRLEFKLLGVMNRKEITEAYGKIDVVVCPSREETMSIALTEGMMHGKVCISSDASVVGMAEYIKDGYNGLIFEHENADELAKKLKYVIENRDSIAAIGKNARNTYEKFFTMEAFVDRLEGITI